jgi:hypothetical protein
VRRRFSPKGRNANTEQLTSCFSGLVAGILGLTNLSGFALYLLTAVVNGLVVGFLKCGGGNVGKYVPAAHGGAGPQGAAKVNIWSGWAGVMGLGTETLLGFMLFWIGGYALVHGEYRGKVERYVVSPLSSIGCSGLRCVSRAVADVPVYDYMPSIATGVV